MFRNWSLNVGLLLSSLLFVELLLHMMSPWTTAVDRLTSPPWELQFIPDPLLGLRGNPYFYEHDQAGFRNTLRPEGVKIVALGDSNTYGARVKAEEAWPHLLSMYKHTAVYNMGMGGYGPLHSLTTLDVALSLKPQLVIFALYFGNDFYDSFVLSMKNGTLKDFATRDRLDEIARLNNRLPLEKEISRLLRGAYPNSDVAKGESEGVHRFRRWVSQNLKIYGLLRTMKYHLAEHKNGGQERGFMQRDIPGSVEAIQTLHLKCCSIFEGKQWKTIFTAPYRNLALNDTDVRIRTGVDISKFAMEGTRERVRTAAAEFLVVLLPTKETVFWPMIDSPVTRLDLEELVRNEDRLRNEIIDFLNREQIRFLDMLPRLREAKAQPYFEDADGHLNAYGHRVIAEAIAGYLSANKFRSIEEADK